MPWTDYRSENRAVLLHYCKSIALLYVVWSAIYFIFPTMYQYGGIDLTLFTKSVKLFFFEASYYHLWYLLATLYAVPLVSVLFQAPKWVRVIFFCTAWILQCLRFTYNWLGIFDLDPMIWVSKNFDAFWNTVCCAVPAMLIGIRCMHTHTKRTSKQWSIRALISAALYFTELTVAYILSEEKLHFEFLICTPLLIYHLFNWLLSVEFSFQDQQRAILLRLSSTWIYCVHPLVIAAFKIIHPSEGIRRFVYVMAVCLLTSWIYSSVKIRSTRRKCA